MPDDLYETDVLVWSERQGQLLRRLAAGERVNADVDWDNVIEEIECVGRSELHRCESLLRQALVHLLRIRAWPSAPSVAHWRGEVVGFLADAKRSYAASMRHRLDLNDIFAHALRQVRLGADESDRPDPLMETCPYALDDLFAEKPDIRALVAKLSA